MRPIFDNDLRMVPLLLPSISILGSLEVLKRLLRGLLGQSSSARDYMAMKMVCIRVSKALRSSGSMMIAKMTGHTSLLSPVSLVCRMIDVVCSLETLFKSYELILVEESHNISDRGPSMMNVTDQVVVVDGASAMEMPLIDCRYFKCIRMEWKVLEEVRGGRNPCRRLMDTNISDQASLETVGCYGSK
jgi:hypothetical protein